MTWSEPVMVLLRGIHVAASLSLFGCLVFWQFVVPAAMRDAPLAMVPRIARVSAWLALVFGGAWLVAVAGTIAGAVTLVAMFDVVPAVAAHTDFGNFLCVRLLLLLIVPPLLRRHPRGAMIVSGAALALQPLLGHVVALQGAIRAVLIPIEMAHLLAAGAWLGGLSPLLLWVARAPPRLAAILCERFTPVGLVAVGTITVTALPQAGELIGGIPGLFGTQYGQFALIKLTLFSVLLALACVNRVVLTTRLDTGRTRNWLIASIATEAVAGLCVVLAAAAMASSPPAEHIQPVWPFPWRPSTVAWDEPELREELVRLLIAAAAGLALIGASLIARRFRVLACTLAVCVAAPFLPALDLLLVEAYPTSYARSTTGFSVGAIAHGQALFGRQCAICHDKRIGGGGGGDLTAPHLWGHLDGELFWSVSNGVADPEGAALMPGFATMLTEDDIWALIDFIRARNIGIQANATGHWSPPIPAPGTPLDCAGNDTEELTDLRGHMLVVAAGNDPAPPIVDVTIIRLFRGSPIAPMPDECVAATPQAWTAWSVLAGVAPDRFEGFQAVVDRRGWLRAWLPPDAGPGGVQAAIRDAIDHPIAAEALSAGGHHH